MRRSLSCILAGTLVAAPIALVAAFPDARPHGTAVVAVISILVIGIMWLRDELAGR
jgi:hypothetical protein